MKTNTITIQKMKISHVPDICKLSYDLFKYHDDLLPDFFAPHNIEKSAQHYRDLKSKKNVIFLVATQENSVVGYILGYILVKPWRKKTSVCVIDEIHVVKSYRRQGIGMALIDQLKIECQKRKVQDINLNVYEPNKNALKFYHKLGFRITSHKMDLEID